MSENLDLVEISREAMDAWNRRDLDRFIGYCDPNVEMLPTGGVAVERAVFRGHDEVAARAAEGWKVWDKIEVSVSEIRDLGDSTLRR